MSEIIHINLRHTIELQYRYERKIATSKQQNSTKLQTARPQIADLRAILDKVVESSVRSLKPRHRILRHIHSTVTNDSECIQIEKNRNFLTTRLAEATEIQG